MSENSRPLMRQIYEALDVDIPTVLQERWDKMEVMIVDGAGNICWKGSLPGTYNVGDQLQIKLNVTFNN